MISLLSSFTNIGCWANMFYRAYHVTFFICESGNNLSNFIKWSEPRGLKTSGVLLVYISWSLRLPSYETFMRSFCRKSQRQTAASTLRNSYALPSYLTCDRVHAVVMSFAPATVQEGKTPKYQVFHSRHFVMPFTLESKSIYIKFLLADVSSLQYPSCNN